MNAAQLILFGFFDGTSVIPPVVETDVGGGWLPVRKKLHEKPRDDTKDDIESAWKRLTGATEAVEKVVAAPVAEIAAFQPVENRLTEALAIAGRLLEEVGPQIERARLRHAAEMAREAQSRLQARMEAQRVAEERAALQRKRRRYKALIAMHLLDE